MSFFYIGLVRGYSAPAVPSIMENNPEIFPTKNIASWASKSEHTFSRIKIIILTITLVMNPWIGITWCDFKQITNYNFCLHFARFFVQLKGSIPPCGAFFGSIVAAACLHYIGRKYTIVIASPLATIGWILTATATRYEVIIASRFLNGFCVGLCLPSAQVYVSTKPFSKFDKFVGN